MLMVNYERIAVAVWAIVIVEAKHDIFDFFYFSVNAQTNAHMQQVDVRWCARVNEQIIIYCR